MFDANELLDKVKIENMLLLDKVKNLELELSVTREQTNRFASSKLEHMLSIQKSPLDKTGLGRLGLISKSLNLRLLTLLRTSCMIDLHGSVIFVEIMGIFVQIVSSCKL